MSKPSDKKPSSQSNSVTVNNSNDNDKPNGGGSSTGTTPNKTETDKQCLMCGVSRCHNMWNCKEITKATTDKQLKEKLICIRCLNKFGRNHKCQRYNDFKGRKGDLFCKACKRYRRKLCNCPPAGNSAATKTVANRTSNV